MESPKLVDAEVPPLVPQVYFQDAQSPIDECFFQDAQSPSDECFFPDTIPDVPVPENLDQHRTSSKGVEGLDINMNSPTPASLGIQSLTIPESWEKQVVSTKVSGVDSAPDTVYDHDSDTESVGSCVTYTHELTQQSNSTHEHLTLLGGVSANYSRSLRPVLCRLKVFELN